MGLVNVESMLFFKSRAHKQRDKTPVRVAQGTHLQTTIQQGGNELQKTDKRGNWQLAIMMSDWS